MRDRPPFRVGVLVSGRGSNLQAIIDAIEKRNLCVEIALVISNKIDAEALQRARQNGIRAEFLDPKDFPDRFSYDRELSQKFQRANVDLVVLAGYMRLVSSVLINSFKNRMINIHPSLLPAFPGLRAHGQALNHGVKVTGCTVHFVDEEVDHGPILLQAAVPVLEGDTEDSLSDRILIEEHHLLPRAIQLLAEERVSFEGRRVIIKEGG